MTFFEKNKWIVLVLLLALAFFLRAYQLNAAGLAEDEVHKIEAARAYLRGDFTVNAEHPMLMKFLDTLSLLAADWWNSGPGHRHAVAEEVAVRVPNLIFGTLSALVLFLLAESWFGTRVGLLTAALWAIGVDAIAINRVAKEDTLLVFFTWLGFYFYLKAKNLGSAEPPERWRYQALSGASFGLMLASKYFPHYMGLNFLYYHMLGRNERNLPVTRRDQKNFFAAFFLAFFLANPIILLPSVIRYLFAYAHEQTVTHHGYWMMGHLYYNNISSTPDGTPAYFYLLMLAVKTPLAVLAMILLGLVLAFLERRHPGHYFLAFMFVLWMIPYSIVGPKWLRYSLSLMPIVYMAAAVGISRSYDFLSQRVEVSRILAGHVVVAAAMVALFLIAPFWVTWRSAPYYSLYLNHFGRGRVAYFFPHDEFYDAGLRETIQQIAAQAPRGAYVGGETPSVFRYYFRRFRRPDLRYFNLTEPFEKNNGTSDSYVVVQDGRRYFENISVIDSLESRAKPILKISIQGATAARVYRVEDLAQIREHR